jgi:hypothetical protein
MRHAIFAVLAGLVTLAAARADGVVLHARLAKGDTMRYDLSARFSAGAPGAADPRRLEQNARLRLTVADIDHDGNATVRIAFESLKARYHSADGDMVYEPADRPGEGGDSALAKIYAELATSILEMQVSPEGTIDKVTGLDSTIGAARAAGFDKPERALGSLSPEALETTLSPIFGLDPSLQQREAGSTWSVIRQVDLTDPYTASVETRYTLGAVKGGVVEASGPVNVSVEAKSRSDASPTLKLTEQSGTAKVRWDAGSSRLVSRLEEKRLVWTATLNLKDPIKSASATESKIELRAVEEK